MFYLFAILASAAFTTAIPITSNSTNSTCDSRASADPGPGVEHHDVVEDGTYLWPYQAFKSSPLHPPVMEINTTSNASLAPGLIYITIGDTTPLPVTKRPSPKIMTDQGQLVWSGPESNATNFKWQLYNGRPTLTYWSGLTTSGANIGHGYGNITFLDETYDVTSVLCPNFDNYNTAGDGTFACESDIHESYLTDRGTMIVSAYNATQTDLTSVGGPADGWIWDSQFYEVNTTTSEVLFRWSPIDHVPVNKTFMPISDNGNSTSPFDYFHLNSVVNIGSDYYLANSRHTWTIYLISKTSGEIIWEFNGNDGGDFEVSEDFLHFSWQHFVRPHNITFETFDVSIYNNNNYSPQEPHVNATDLLVYTLPIPSSKNSGSSDMKATLKSRIQTSKPLYDDSQGSYFPQLSNGNSFADFGQLPILKEFDSEGKEIWSAQLGVNNLAQIYRGYKLDGWSATPYYKPDLVVQDGKGYVSWNGATDVEGWNVYVGKEEGNLELVGQVGFRGFETMFNVPCWAKYVQVGAVEKGKEVTRSEVFGLQ